METTEKIDRDLDVLHEEMMRRDGKFHLRVNRRRKYILGIGFLLTLLFLFGFLATPTPPVFVSQETPVLLDTAAPRVVNPELSQRLLALFQGGATEGTLALLPDTPTQATVPTIHTWTPNALGKLNADGTIVPVTGTYSIPGGWYGAIRLLSDGREIGKTFVDARSHNTPMGGSFLITPIREEGQHTVHLVFDATKSCRIACAPGDQLCQATNVNYCHAQSDNQSFLAYTPASSEAQPPLGQCVTKTFVAGPIHAPQTADEYPACDITPIVRDLAGWLSQISGNKGDVYPEQIQKVIDGVTNSYSSRTLEISGIEGKIQWKYTNRPWNTSEKLSCLLKLETKVFCPISQNPSYQSQNFPPETMGDYITEIIHTVLGVKTAYAANAVCGSANGTTILAPETYRNPTDLCSVGTFVDQPNTAANYFWGCNGTAGGTNANCSANVDPSPGVCTGLGTIYSGFWTCDPYGCSNYPMYFPAFYFMGSPVPASNDADCKTQVQNAVAVDNATCIANGTCLGGVVYRSHTFSQGSFTAGQTVDAGTDQTLVLPVNSTTLSGSYTDGGVLAFADWIFVSGPSNVSGVVPGAYLDPTGTLSTRTPTLGGGTVSIPISGLQQGLYAFRLQLMYLGGAGPWDVRFIEDEMVVNVTNSIVTECSDGIDNDVPNDGKIDFGVGPTNDPGCSSASDDDETDPVTGNCTWVPDSGNPDICDNVAVSMCYPAVPSCSPSNPSGNNCNVQGQGSVCVHKWVSGPNTNVNVYTCQGTCSSSAPVESITVSPQILDYGTLPVGGIGTLNITIRNTGTIPVSGLVNLPPNGNSSHTVTLGSSFTNLAPGASVVKSIQLTANASGPLGGLGNVTLNSNGFSVPITLTGTGESKTELEVTDVRNGNTIVTSPYAPIVIGSLIPSSPVQNYDFEIRNIGASSMNYQVQFSGPAPVGYSLVNVTPNGCGGAATPAIPLGMLPVRVCRLSFNPAISALNAPQTVVVQFVNTTPGGAASSQLPLQYDISFSATVNSDPFVEMIPDPKITKINFDEYEINFGNVLVGTPVSQTFNFQNTGGGTVNIVHGSLATADFTAPAGNQAGIPNLGIHSIPITFQPSVAGVRPPGIITVNTTAPNITGIITLRVRGTGIVQPNIEITGPGCPACSTVVIGDGNVLNINFGTQDINAGPLSRVITIDNTGSANSTVSFVSSNPTIFTVVPVTNNNVPAGGSRFFNVNFDPSAVTSYNDQIDVSATGVVGLTRIFVQGVGTDATGNLIVAPSPLAFGKVIVNKTKRLNLRITNNDPAATFTFNNSSWVGGGYSCVTNCGAFVLPPGGSHDVTIEFSPTVIGSYIGTFTFNLNTGSTLPVTLTGDGARPTIIYTDPPVGF